VGARAKGLRRWEGRISEAGSWLALIPHRRLGDPPLPLPYRPCAPFAQVAESQLLASPAYAE